MRASLWERFLVKGESRSGERSGTSFLRKALAVTARAFLLPATLPGTADSASMQQV